MFGLCLRQSFVMQLFVVAVASTALLSAVFEKPQFDTCIAFYFLRSQFVKNCIFCLWKPG
jgi:hypothetical protein